jgi:ASC-1-like (ASCH) protein
MKKHILKIRQVDKVFFEVIKEGRKTIESRAAIDRYRKIKEGDVLVFVCGSEKLEKKVKKVEYYKTIEEMTKVINFKKVMPFVDSIEEMKKVYFSFPDYKQKIDKFGLVVFKLKVE